MESANSPTLREASTVHPAQQRTWKQITRSIAGWTLSCHSTVLCGSLWIMEHLRLLREETAHLRNLLKGRTETSTADNRYTDSYMRGAEYQALNFCGLKYVSSKGDVIITNGPVTVNNFIANQRSELLRQMYRTALQYLLVFLFAAELFKMWFF